MQWLMLQQAQAEDFVIATGVQHSVRDFVNLAARELDIQIAWEGEGVEEKGYWVNAPESRSKKQQIKRAPIVAVDPRYFRPAEVDSLLGDPSKAKQKLGWVPKISFQELVSEMVRADLDSAERDELIKYHGFRTLDHHE